MATLCLIPALIGLAWTLGLLLNQVLMAKVLLRVQRWRETPTLLRDSRERPEWWFIERMEED